MYAVDVVVSCHFGAEVGEVAGGLSVFGVHVAVGTYLLYVVRHLLAESPAAVGVPFAHGYRHNPCVQLHAAAVAFVDGELQCVVAWTLARHAGEASVPRFVGRRIDDSASYACLQQYGVDVGELQTVENPSQFVLLLLYGSVGLCV